MQLQAEGHQSAPAQCQELGEGPGADSLPRSSDRDSPADTLISDIWTPELGQNSFMLFKPQCGASLEQCLQTNATSSSLVVSRHRPPAEPAGMRLTKWTKSQPSVTMGDGWVGVKLGVSAYWPAHTSSGEAYRDPTWSPVCPLGPLCCLLS